MPIYEYRCQSCGHELELLQRISEPAATDCPECGKSELRRLISAAGFRLKGGGWYETDFKQGNKRNLADGGKPETDAKKESGDAAKESGKSGKKEATAGTAGTADAA